MTSGSGFSGSSGVLLTLQDVARWKDEEARFLEAARQATAEAELRRRKIDAAAFFMPSEETPIGPTEGGAPKSMTLRSAVIMALEAQWPMSPKQLRERIIAQGNGESLGAQNALYSMLTKLQQANVIVRVGDGYGLVGWEALDPTDPEDTIAMKFPEKENPGIRAPGSSETALETPGSVTPEDGGT